MAKTADNAIRLAGQDYTVNPLSLGQIEAMCIAVTLPDGEGPQEEVRRNFKRSIDTLVIALSAAYPEVDDNALRALPISRAELNEAFNKVLRLSGLVPSGEASAAPPSTGAGSTGA